LAAPNFHLTRPAEIPIFIIMAIPQPEPFDLRNSPALIAPNNFKYKSRSSRGFNIQGVAITNFARDR